MRAETVEDPPRTPVRGDAVETSPPVGAAWGTHATGRMGIGAPGSLVGILSSTPREPPVVNTPARRRLLGRGSWPETQRLTELLRAETFGGVLLIVAAVLALVAANTTDVYADVRDTVVGPAALHLDLSIGGWAADGLLAIFFFVVGLELKRELVAGDLRDPSRAAVPIVAAVGGMIVPALLYVLVNSLDDRGRLVGWAIPSATDIAFALAVLAVVVNAIRLAILARSDEIAIMRIVGASAAWVRLPFILEGLAIGAAGALITLFIFGILSASIGAVMLNLFRVLPVQTSAILAGQVSLSVIAAGLGLGALGALLFLRGRLN